MCVRACVCVCSLVCVRYVCDVCGRSGFTRAWMPSCVMCVCVCVCVCVCACLCVCVSFVTPLETNIIDLWVSPFESCVCVCVCMLVCVCVCDVCGSPAAAGPDAASAGQEQGRSQCHRDKSHRHHHRHRGWEQVECQRRHSDPCAPHPPLLSRPLLLLLLLLLLPTLPPLLPLPTCKGCSDGRGGLRHSAAVRAVRPSPPWACPARSPRPRWR
jgi:hypothetical protein